MNENKPTRFAPRFIKAGLGYDAGTGGRLRRYDLLVKGGTVIDPSQGKRSEPSVIRELLPLLDPGDIVTHLFTANPGGVLDASGKLVPEASELKDRDVWLDTAHGRLNFPA